MTRFPPADEAAVDPARPSAKPPDESRGPSDGWRLRMLLTALVAFGPLSTDLYLPALPMMVDSLRTDVASVQLTLSVFLLGFAASQLIYGPLSDRYGRRPALLWGVAIYVIASIGCIFATTIEALIIARFFQALGACSGAVVGRAVVRDVFGRERSASILSYMAMAMSLAPAIGPVLGGMLTEWGSWQGNFALLALFGIIMLASVFFGLPESNRHRDADAIRPGRMLANYVLLLRDRVFSGHILIITGVYSAIFAFISGSSFVLINQLGLGPSAFGMAFGIVVLGYMIGSYLSGRLSMRVGAGRMMTIGSSLATAAGFIGWLVAIFGIVTPVTVMIPVFFVLIGAGLTLANAQARAIGPYPAMAGLASSLLGFTQMSGAALVSFAVGHLLEGSAATMLGTIAISALTAALAQRFLTQPRA